MRKEIQAIVNRYHCDRTELLAILREVQEKWRMVSPKMVAIIADEMDLPLVHVEGTATFYHFLSRTHRGKYSVYVNTSATAEMAGASAVIKAFETELGLSMGHNSPENLVGLRRTSCIGMSDQEPAILINGTVFTQVTPERVHELVKGMKSNAPVHELIRVSQTPGTSGDNEKTSTHIRSEVRNNIRVRGPVFFSDYVSGTGLREPWNTARWMSLK